MVAKLAHRAQSRYARDAVLLIGRLVRTARLQRKLTVVELAERAGLSRGLVQRIERGNPGCAIGAVFETAAVVGVRLFDADETELAARISANAAMLALMPKTARAPLIAVKDDF